MYNTNIERPSLNYLVFEFRENVLITKYIFKFKPPNLKKKYKFFLIFKD